METRRRSPAKSMESLNIWARLMEIVRKFALFRQTLMCAKIAVISIHVQSGAVQKAELLIQSSWLLFIVIVTGADKNVNVCHNIRP